MLRTEDEPSVSWVITDPAGDILEVSAAAAEMLNFSAMHLRQRSLLLFFNADRPEWHRLLRLAAAGQLVERSGAVRPRNRRARVVHVELTAVGDYWFPNALEWRFSVLERPGDARTAKSLRLSPEDGVESRSA